MKFACKLMLSIIALMLSVVMVFAGCSDKDKNAESSKTEKADVTEDINDKVPAEIASEPKKIDTFAEEKSATAEMVSNKFTRLSNGFFSGVERYEALDFDTLSTKLKAKLETGDGFEAFSNDFQSLKPAYEYMSSLGIDNVEIDMKLDMSDDAIKTEAEGSVNDESVIDGSFIVDKDNGDLYFEIPDVSDDTYYLNITSGSSADSFVDSVESFRESQLTLGKAGELATLLFDEDSADLTADYICYLFDLLGEGEENTAEFDVEGVTKECRRISYELSEEKVNEMTVKLLEKLKDDELFKEKIIEIADFCIDNDFGSDLFGAVSDGNEFYEDIVVPSIDVAVSDIKDAGVDEDAVVYLSLYFDGDVLAGMVADDGESIITIASLENEGSTATKFVIDDNGSVSGFTLIGTINDSLYSSTFALYDGSTDTETVTVFSEFDLDKYAEGIFCGKIEIDGDTVALFSDLNFSKEHELTIDFDSDFATYCDMNITAKYDGNQAFTLGLDVDIDDNAANIEIPEDYKDFEELSVFSETMFKQSLISTLVENLVNAGVSRRAILDLAASLIM